MASTSDKERILLYEVEKDHRWVVYWVSSTFGITNFTGLAYEINLNIQERRNLMGNVAESLLKNKWSNTFKSKAFVIEKLDDESALVKYVTKSVELPRIVDNDKIFDANKKLFFGVYSMLQDYQQNLPDKGLKRNASSNLISSHYPLKKNKWTQPKLREKRKPGDNIITGPICFDKNNEENVKYEEKVLIGKD
ncbi:hypothetical protein Mgra_00000752 [Meloidogyne graminicola]|uniref:Uncharacterized protein n=1 Tax=Meloidogyne graminicola TaxID=189291 RepID=A0A8T0A2P2_9BILA|nr:hypothetical protein Mgra_00000752 [Meloidogyne graminicola]